MPRPEAKYAPAPLYSELWQQAARRWAQRPVAFRQQWPEHPSPAFIACLFFIAAGLVSFVLGITGVIGKTPTHLLARNEIPRLAADLVGSTPEAARRFLGEPEMVRREPPAEIWQYRNGTCVLDVYVYGTVTYAEVRERRRNQHEKDPALHNRDCLRSFHFAASN